MLGIIPECKRKLDVADVVGAASAPQQVIHLGVSQTQRLWILFIHAAMLLIFLYFFLVLKLPLLIFLLLLGFSVCVLLAELRRYRRSCGCRLSFGAQGWFFFDVLGRRSRMQFDRALIWPGLVVLYFCGTTCPARTVVITPDRVGAQELRRLRVYLRMSL